MQKFGFTIRTRGGSMVDNLVIQGRDQADAEKKLRQVYHHCEIVQVRAINEPAAAEASDFEGLISLIAAEGREPPEGGPKA